MNNEKAALLVVMCFEARTKSHLAHLQTKSYAQHIAFNEFYDGIVGLTDSFAEAFQGRYGIIESYSTISSTSKGLENIKSLRNWIDANRQECGDFSELQNEIDNIVNLCNSTIYKLENLS